MSVELPRVLENGQYIRRLHPISCSVSQSLTPLSTANLELPATDEIENLDWVQIFTPDGKAEYYRVSSVSTNTVTGDKSAYLEHGACTLGDILIPDVSQDATVTPTSSHGANLKVYPENKTDTISNLVTYILGKQPSPAKWTKGTIESTATIYIELGGSDLLSSLSTMMQYIPEYQMEFVQNDASNWVVNVKHRPSTVLCEGRLSRNLTSCDVSYNTSNLCTRVYADGIGYINSTNISTYGVHEETQNLNDNLNTTQKTAIINSYLANRDHPTVSISISGIELSQITGLTIDQFTVGSVCRIAIPWLNLTEEEVVLDKKYSDVYNAPEQVSITLANATPDLVIAMAAVTSRTGGRGGGLAGQQAQKEKEKKRFETHFEQTDKYFKWVASDTQWNEMGEATHTAYGEVKLTSDTFQVVLDEVGDGDLLGGTGTITPATIAASINEEGSEALINADHIYLNATQEITLAGMVQVDGTTFQIEDGVNGDGTLTCNTIECYNLEVDGEISTNGLILNSGATFQVDGDSVTWQSTTVVTSASVTLPTVSVSALKNLGVVSPTTLEVTDFVNGRVVTGHTNGSSSFGTATIHYLGKAAN